MPLPEELPLAVLLEELEEAVAAHNRPLALELSNTLLARLPDEPVGETERDLIETRIHHLLAHLDEPKSIHDLTGSVVLPWLERDIALAKPGDLVYPVWFGTNRKPTGDGRTFTHERHTETTHGRVDVYVPNAHRFGETGNGFWKRLLRWDLQDDNPRIVGLEQQDQDEFFDEIRATMQDAAETGATPSALLYIHGFNVSFDEAAIRAAQIGFDLRVPGTTAFFSWPSRGTVAGYPADEATIEASEQAITEFLVDFTRNCGSDKVHIIAHSMGNRGLLRALQRIAANAEHYGAFKLGQIFLAAPDVDRAVFLDLAHLYPAHAERVTLYTSDADKAVHISKTLHDAPRAGYFTPYTIVEGVDTVAVPDFDLDVLGHSYFAQAGALLYDLYDLMSEGKPPRDRLRLKSAQADDGKIYWEMGQ